MSARVKAIRGCGCVHKVEGPGGQQSGCRWREAYLEVVREVEHVESTLQNLRHHLIGPLFRGTLVGDRDSKVPLACTSTEPLMGGETTPVACCGSRGQVEGSPCLRCDVRGVYVSGGLGTPEVGVCLEPSNHMIGPLFRGTRVGSWQRGNVPAEGGPESSGMCCDPQRADHRKEGVGEEGLRRATGRAILSLWGM